MNYRFFNLNIMTYDITNYQILDEKNLCENDFLKFNKDCMNPPSGG